MGTLYRQNGFTIRSATKADLEYLPAIEIAAGALFPRDRIADPEDTLDIEIVESSLAQKALLVAEVDAKVVGLIVNVFIDQFLHVEEVSVHPDYGRRGIGRALMAAALDLASQHSLEYVTLTTFADLQWNGPFYGSLGFSTYAPKTAPQWLENILKHEKDLGMTNRIAMYMPPVPLHSTVN